MCVWLALLGREPSAPPPRNFQSNGIRQTSRQSRKRKIQTIDLHSNGGQVSSSSFYEDDEEDDEEGDGCIHLLGSRNM